MYLETSRVILREITSSDVDNLLLIDRDPEVMRFISNGQPSTREWWVATALPTIQSYYVKYEGRLGNWAAIDKLTSEFIGWFHLRPDKQDLENTKVLELGFRLKASQWGKGIATEVSAALVTKAFEDLNAEHIFAKAMKANLASVKVMKNIGMEYELDYVESAFPGQDQRAVKYSVKADDRK